MDPVLVLLGVGGLVGGPAVVGLALWRLFAARAPEVRPAGAVERLGRHRVLRRFEVGPITVSCEEHGVGRPFVILSAAVPDGVWIEPVRPLRLAERALGDPAFDRAFESGGEVALLTAELRAALLAANEGHQVRVIGGRLELRWAGRADDDDALAPHLERVRAVLAAFPATVADARRRSAEAEPVPALRVRAIHRLIEVEDPEADAVLARAIASDAPAVALAAAVLRSDLPALRRILRSDAPAEVRRSALDVLVAKDDDAALEPLIREALAGDLLPHAVAAVARHPRRPLALALVSGVRDALGRVPAAQRGDVERALASIAVDLPPSAPVEDLLVALLAAEDVRVRRSAARGLAVLGTPRALPALRAALAAEAAAQGVTALASIEHAITSVRGRAGASEGSLSVAAAPPGAGGLSPTEGRRGRLAEEPEREPGAG